MAGKKDDGLLHKKPSAPFPATEKPAGDVPYIPIDVWTGILIRTPAEDLVRFKGVCKAWYELISSQSFAEFHVDHWTTSQTISRLLLNVNYEPVNGLFQTDIFYVSNVYHMGSKTGYAWLLRENLNNHSCMYHNLLTSRQQTELGCGSKGLRVITSCDGLILICYREQTHSRLLICNPVTGSYKNLPVFQPTGPRYYIWSDYEWTMLRTGSGRYKIFGIEEWGVSERRNKKCYIFELQIGMKEQPESQWKELMVPLPLEWSIEASTAKDGKLHWLATRLPGRDDNYDTLKVLSIDILTEEFSASVSVQLLEDMDSDYFALKGAFYRAVYRQDEVSLLSLENFDTMMWTEGKISRNSNPESLFLSGKHAYVIGENKVVVDSYGEIYVLDVISKEFGSLRFDFKGSHNWVSSRVVLHTDSLIGCN